MKLCFDCETSILNKGNPYSKGARLISYSYRREDTPTLFDYFKELNFLTDLRSELAKARLLIGFNIKFDLAHIGRHGLRPREGCRIFDCQIAEFIISGQKMAYPSLNECLAKYGQEQKDDKIAEYWKAGIDTEFIPEDELRNYNNWDVDLTYHLYLKQWEVMSEKQRKLCLVMGLDLLVLQEMEENGVKFDVELCKTKGIETEVSLKEITEELLRYSPTKDINLDSGQQLSCLLYGGKFEVDYITEEQTTYKSGPKKGERYVKNIHNEIVFECPRLFEPLPKSETKLKKKLGDEEIAIYVTNEDTLKQLKAKSKLQKQIIELLLKRAELAKLLDTYYGKLPAMLDKMEWGDYLHGQYNQSVAATGRLSSSNPNMQNFSGDVDKLLVSRYD